MSRILQSPWLTALVGCVSYLFTTTMLWRAPALHVEPREGGSDAALAGPVPSWNFHNPEVDALIRELREERDLLKVQKARLDEWAARLESERTELTTLTQRVVLMQADLDNIITRVRDDEKENLKRLAKLYSTMSAEGAAKVLSEMTDDSAVKILATMKDSDTAAILEAIGAEPGKTKKVAQLCEKLRLLVARSPTAAKPAAK